MTLRLSSAALLILIGAWLAFSFALSSSLAAAQTGSPLLIAYAGQNENAAPMWVGIENGIFKKYGLDVKMVQLRNGPLSIATLTSGQVQYDWTSPSTVLSAASGGVKLQCAASGINKIPRDLVARKEIRTLEELHGKVFGVQSIGGGFWLQTMVGLDALGIDANKYDLKMRVVGDTATVTQAIASGNIDAAIIPYSFSEAAKRAGAHVLADIGKLDTPYQGTTLCYTQEMATSAPDVITRLIKGIVDAVVLIHEPKRKPEIMEVLRRNFRFDKSEEAEASYRVLRIASTVDVAPSIPAWKTVQRIVNRINPKVGRVDLNQLLNRTFVRRLEESGFLAEARKKMH